MSGEKQTDGLQKLKARAINALIYLLIGSPGAYAAYTNQDRATVEIVRKVNVKRADDIEGLQDWTRSNKDLIEKLAKSLEEFRREVAEDRRETNRILFQLANRSRSKSGRILREEIRDRREKPEPVPRITAQIKSQRRKLPTLKRPAKALADL